MPAREVEGASDRSDVPARSIKCLPKELLLKTARRLVEGYRTSICRSGRGSSLGGIQMLSFHTQAPLAVRPHDPRCYHVGELADVALPVGVLQRENPSRRKFHRGKPVGLTGASAEVDSERGDVLSALCQIRNPDREGAQPVVEVFPESLLGDSSG